MSTRTALGDALDALIDYRGKTPKKLGGDWSPSGHRVISALNIKNNRVDDNDHHYVSDDIYAKWMKEPLRQGDVLLTSEAPLGEVAYLDREVDWCLGQRLFGLRGKAGVLDGRYLSYLLRGGSVRNEILSRSTGSTVAGIRQAELVKVLLDLPDIAVQEGVAATLGALDDKIESNGQAQVTGENLIRSLVTAALERSTGEVGVLGDYCNLVKEPARTGVLTADLSYIAFEHMPRGSIFLDDWGNAEWLGSDKSYFQTGDILFGKLRPYFKKVGIAPVDGVCSTDILVLRPIREADRALVAIVASSDPLIDSLSAAATGTRMPRASWKDLSNWPVSEMTTTERDSLRDQVGLLVERLMELTHETKQLQLLRDALLPEFLSGRIRVPEAEGSLA